MFYYYHFHYNSTQNIANRACVEEAKESIYTPATFRLVNVDVIESNITWNQYYSLFGKTKESESQRIIEIQMLAGRSREEGEAFVRNRHAATPGTKTISVTFDASNIMGALVRQTHQCVYLLMDNRGAITEDMISMRKMAVNIDRVNRSLDEIRDRIRVLNGILNTPTR
jgi:hypothetical protein